MQDQNPPQPGTQKSSQKSATRLAVVILLIALAAFGVWYTRSKKATAPSTESIVPGISDVQIGTYSTTTKSIVTEKSEFTQTEEIGFHGVVHNLPGNSALMVIMSSGGKNYYYNLLPNGSPVLSGPFHFVYGQKRPAGTYTLLLELFGPDKQQIGEKVIKEFTVK